MVRPGALAQAGCHSPCLVGLLFIAGVFGEVFCAHDVTLGADTVDTREYRRVAADGTINTSCTSTERTENLTVEVGNGVCSDKGAPILCQRGDSYDGPCFPLGDKAHLRCDSLFERVRDAFGVPHPSEIVGDAIARLSYTCREGQECFNLVTGGQAGTGKSNADFMTTPDGRYIFKSMTSGELKIWETVVDKYVDHMLKYRTETMLVRIYGIIKIHSNSVFSSGKRWLLMNNFMPFKFPFQYDLKGSTRGRVTKSESQQQKDMNFRQDGRRMLVPTTQKRAMNKAITQDTELLKESWLLDYSMTLAQLSFKVPRCEKRTSGLISMMQNRSRPLPRSDDQGPDASLLQATGKIAECVSSEPICFGVQGETDELVCVEVTDQTDRWEHWQHVGNFFCDEFGGIGSVKRTKSERANEKTRSRVKASGPHHSCIGSLRVPNDGDDYVQVNFACFGIIDLLKYWGFSSKVEHFFSRSGASVKRPPKYKERFDYFMERAMDGEWASEPDRKSATFRMPKRTSDRQQMCESWGQKHTMSQSSDEEEDLDFDKRTDYVDDPSKDDEVLDDPAEDALYVRHGQSGTSSGGGGMMNTLGIVFIILLVVVVAGGVLYMYMGKASGGPVSSGAEPERCRACGNSGMAQNGQPCNCPWGVQLMASGAGQYGGQQYCPAPQCSTDFGMAPPAQYPPPGAYGQVQVEVDVYAVQGGAPGSNITMGAGRAPQAADHAPQAGSPAAW